MNKSFAYLLPLFSKYLISENKELEEAYFAIWVEECYCYCKVNDKLENIYTIKLTKPEKKNEIYQKYLSSLKKSNIFANQHNTEESNYISFKIPKEIENTYLKYLKGEYSKINSKDKTIALSFIKNRISKEYSIKMNRIFSKNEKEREELENKIGMKLPKDSELSSKPNKISETFKID